MKSFGQAIRALREKLGLSSAEVARRAGVCHATVSLLECHAERDPSMLTARRIAKVLGTTVGDIEKELAPITLTPIPLAPRSGRPPGRPRKIGLYKNNRSAVS